MSKIDNFKLENFDNGISFSRNACAFLGKLKQTGEFYV